MLGGNFHWRVQYNQRHLTRVLLETVCWRPERSVLAAIRLALDDNPKGFSRDHPTIDDLRRIDFIAVAPLGESDVTAPDLVKLLTQRVRQARPLMRFLCDATGTPC